jgi:two-component system chemotaxis sensor kinase CheA
MTIDLDDEILQDFLVEAGEILEQLSEQLVVLEQSPGDFDLLNAIFRGFHTVKGGAGFLAIHELVEICHSAEDVFNVLRQGDRQVTAELMDVILQVLDIVNDMFASVRAGESPEAAPTELLTRLKAYASNVNEPPSIQVIAAEPVIAKVTAQDQVAQEFESMLGADVQPTPSESRLEADEITEQEFEDLLDALHGKGGSDRKSVV